MQLVGDGWFLAAMDSYLHLKRANIETSSTYVYLLTSKSSASYSSRYGGEPDKYYGVAHMDEGKNLIFEMISNKNLIKTNRIWKSYLFIPSKRTDICQLLTIKRGRTRPKSNGKNVDRFRSNWVRHTLALHVICCLLLYLRYK